MALAVCDVKHRHDGGEVNCVLRVACCVLCVNRYVCGVLCDTSVFHVMCCVLFMWVCVVACLSACARDCECVHVRAYVRACEIMCIIERVC